MIEHAEILREGDDSGNEMMVRWRLPSGLEIVGLPTKNAYGCNTILSAAEPLSPF